MPRLSEEKTEAPLPALTAHQVLSTPLSTLSRPQPSLSVCSRGQVRAHLPHCLSAASSLPSHLSQQSTHPSNVHHRNPSCGPQASPCVRSQLWPQPLPAADVGTPSVPQEAGGLYPNPPPAVASRRPLWPSTG